MAWKNIWRQKVRSMVLIIATAVGVWSLIFLLSWVFGIVKSFIGNSVDQRLGHIQIHHPEYGKEFDVQKSFSLKEVENLLMENGVNHSPRLVVQSLVKSSRSTRGLIIKGVDPKQDSSCVSLSKSLVEGDFLKKKVRNPIVVSKVVAEQLKLKLNSKLVAQFQDKNGELASAAFRIVGVYDSGDLKLDQLFGFAKIEDIRRLTNMEDDEVHEILIKLDNIDKADEKQREWSTANSNLLIETYAQLSPDIKLFSTQIHLNVIIMTVIFMLALIFGIINTMLMAVLERMKELGMLMAIGMNKLKVFIMIVLETVMLTMVGVPLGLFLGWLTINRLQINGINLSNWSEGLRQFGLSHIVRPELDWEYFVFVAASVALTAFLAAIYPSLKAIRLNPVDALRKI